MDLYKEERIGMGEITVARERTVKVLNAVGKYRHLQKLSEEEGTRKIAETLMVSQEKARDMYRAMNEWSRGDYRDVRALQHGESLSDYDKKTAERIERDLEAYIEKAEKWDGGTTFRGMVLKEDAISSLQKGKTISMNGTSSWTTSSWIGKSYARWEGKLRKDEYRVLFQNPKEQKKGVSINIASFHPEEREVTVSKKASFIITDVERKRKNIIVTVESL